MPRGGFRAGAGRPKVHGQDGAESKVIRVPASQVHAIRQLLAQAQENAIPLYLSKVQAGFPSPADDYIERYLDLNTEYVKNPSATFMVTASGQSMIDAGIFDGDVLLVDRSLDATDGSIIIAALNGELTVKRLSKKASGVQLLPANPLFKPITITEELDMVIWGVVTLVLHRPK